MYRTPNGLIIENQKISGGEVLDTLGLFSLEKEYRSNPDGWKLNSHYFLLEVSHHFL